MENVIEKLRELIGDDYEGMSGDETHENVDSIIDAYKPKGYRVEHVHGTFEEGGRWTNYVTDVYKITQDDGKTAYFSIGRDVPATEMQDGSYLSVYIFEVVPKEVVRIEYVYGRSA
ncbi:hypothetical protein MKY59_21620 [Paenibacillus sp. FSL W8-0426]|uniref:hypothetical protein n=1 Tax=Paenibacillus sp. FSL W8-0426 TaxID=2921714 RepID=UPI0030D894DF